MNLPIPDKEKYLSEYPFPHLVIDDALDIDNLKHWVTDIWPKINGKGLRIGTTDETVFGGYISYFIKNYFHSQRFILFLQKLTGIEGLMLDPFEIGLHETFPGGYLDKHIDYTINPRTGLQHRVNAILYLNEDWKLEYEGYLELYNEDKLVRTICPIFNRLVIFNVKDALHGHPKPLACPEGMSRKSIALNYFTLPEKDAKDRSTIYKKKPTIKSFIKSLIPPIFFK